MNSITSNINTKYFSQSAQRVYSFALKNRAILKVAFVAGLALAVVGLAVYLYKRQNSSLPPENPEQNPNPRVPSGPNTPPSIPPGTSPDTPPPSPVASPQTPLATPPPSPIASPQTPPNTPPPSLIASPQTPHPQDKRNPSHRRSQSWSVITTTKRTPSSPEPTLNSTAQKVDDTTPFALPKSAYAEPENTESPVLSSFCNVHSPSPVISSKDFDETPILQTTISLPPQLSSAEQLNSSFSSFVDFIQTSQELAGIENENNTCFLATAIQMILLNPTLKEALIEEWCENGITGKFGEFLFKCCNAIKDGSFSVQGVAELRRVLQEITGNPEYLEGQWEAYEVIRILISDKNSSLYQRLLQKGYFLVQSEKRYYEIPDGNVPQENSGLKKDASSENQWYSETLTEQPAQIELNLANVSDNTPLNELIAQSQMTVTEGEGREFSMVDGQTITCKQLCTRTTWDTPSVEYATVSINRTGYDPVSKRAFKIKTPLDVEEKIYLSIQDIRASMDLIGFTVHLGETPTSGHWISYTYKDGRYTRNSDNSIEPISKEEFLKAAKDASDLFYKKSPIANESLDELSELYQSCFDLFPLEQPEPIAKEPTPEIQSSNKTNTKGVSFDNSLKAIETEQPATKNSALLNSHFKQRVSELTQKNPAQLSIATRRNIASRFMLADAHNRFVGWDIDKLLNEIEKYLPHIRFNKQEFKSVEELLKLFGTTKSELEDEQPVKLIYTLACLTYSGSKECRQAYKTLIKNEFKGFKTNNISFQKEVSPTIEISYNQQLNRTKIEIRHLIYLPNLDHISNPIPLEAILSLTELDQSQISIRASANTNPSVNASLIGYALAQFTWDRESASQEPLSPNFVLPPLDVIDSQYLSNFTSNWMPTSNILSNAYQAIQEQLLHQPHPLHDEKYLIGLNTALSAFTNWLKANPSQEQDPKTFIETLKENSKGAFIGKVAEALDALMDTQSPIRARHFKHLFALRDAYRSDDPKNPEFELIRSLLKEIFWHKFTNNKMTEYSDRFIHAAIGGRPTPNTLDIGCIANAIETSNRLLKDCPPEMKKTILAGAKQKAANSFDIFSDPLGESNVPEIRSVHTVTHNGDTYPVLYLRHGTPTYQYPPGTGSVAIVPEYRGFLDEAEKKQVPVLYVNHQLMIESSILYPEARQEYNRSCLIQALENEYSHFHFLSLPVDDKIWSATRLERGYTAQWMKDLVDDLIQERHGFRLPKNFKSMHNNLEKKFLEIAQTIQQLYFKGDELTPNQRKIFLTIFYSYIKEVVKSTYGIKAMVSACKDNKDRGNASTGIDEALFYLRSGLENDDSRLRALYTQTLAAFYIKYEPVIPKRLNLLLNLLNHIANLSGPERAAIRNYHPVEGYSVSIKQEDEA